MKGPALSPRFLAVWNASRQRHRVFRDILDRLVDRPTERLLQDEEVGDVSRFFEGRSFRPALLADEIRALTRPLVFCGNTFYRYHVDGVWRAVDVRELEAIGGQILGRHARTSWIRDAVNLLGLKTTRPIEGFISDSNFINLLNGMLNVRSGAFLPHAPEFNSRFQLPYEYHANAVCLRWLQFLEEIFPDDPAQVKILQQIFGYCLTPLTFLQCLFMFVGSGANGKGVVLAVLEAMVGHENVCSIAPDQMHRQFLICQLKDKLVNLGGEVDTSRPLPSNMIKALTGEDTITADVKNRDPITFRPTAKHVFAVNEMIRFRDATYALQRRIVFLLFTRTFDAASRDPDLKQKLIAELPGILNWALGGLVDLLANGGISKSRTMREYERKFAEAMNPVLPFVASRCRVGHPKSRIKRTRLYLEYSRWHTANVSDYALSAARFFRLLEEAFSAVRRARIHGVDYFKGIDLKTKSKMKQPIRRKKRQSKSGGRGGSDS